MRAVPTLARNCFASGLICRRSAWQRLATPTGGEDADGFGLRVLGDQKRGETIMAKQEHLQVNQGNVAPGY